MNRLYARFELCGLAVALAALGPACNPKSNVAPGAPVLTEIKIVENGGANITTISATTADCAATVADQGTCDPKAVAICRQPAASNWCRCNANPAPSAPAATPNCVDGSVVDAAPTTADAGGADAGATTDAGPNLGGTWDCSPFTPTARPLFVFDRLLDTAPLDPGDAGALTDIATAQFTPMPAVPVALNASYNSNGSPNEIIFPLLGDFLDDGPGLLFNGVPALPAGAVVTMALRADKVLAKDGKTPFAAGGSATDGSPSVLDGSLSFRTAGFAFSFSSQPTPPALPADAGVCATPPTTVAPDKTPVVLAFNDTVDPAVVATHVTIMAGTTSLAFEATSKDGLSVTLTPDAAWPAGSTITVAVDGTTPDVLGDTLGAAGAASTSFTTSAM